MKSRSGSLLDIHKYSKEALHELYDGMCEIFEDKHGKLKSITSFVIRLVQDDETIKPIIQKMDNIDGIKAQNSKSTNEKRVESWLKNAYYKHIFNDYSISRKHLLIFMKSVINPQNEEGEKRLKYSTIRYFEQYNDKFKKRLKRCRANKRVAKVQNNYKDFNVVDAFAYAQIVDKFNTTNQDIEVFEKIIKILILKKGV
jgi:hypothetical protein